MDTLSLRFDHAGAEALLGALEGTSFSDAEADDLLRVPGVRATVANTTRYLPDHTEAAFRAAVRTWVGTRQEPWGHFGLEFAAEHTAEVRTLISRLDADDGLISAVRAPLDRYRPSTGPLDVTVYSVVGGVSDGFVLDGQPDAAFYMALDRAQGDAAGVALNMTHELYHVLQQTARSLAARLPDAPVDPGAASPATRLLMTVLDEGTATWVARSLLGGDGPYLTTWRSAYEKNAGPDAVRANFAAFDRLLAAMIDGTMRWEEAYGEGFSGTGPPLYFAGFEMARAIEDARGPEKIGTYFAGHPRRFFEDFVALMPGSLAPRTEVLLAATDAAPES